MPFLSVRGLELYYEELGEGRPVLLISGSGGDLRGTPLERNPLTASFRTVACDQRGLGQTSKPDVDYSMADYADDAAALLDVLGIERAHVVGISFGGMVAQNLAVRHPDRIDRLVLMCTSPGGPDLSSADLLALSKLPEAERAAAYLPMLDTRAVGGHVPDDLVPILKMMGRRPVVEGEAAMGARRQLEARAGHDVVDQLPSVTAPTLVAGGRYDGIAPVRNLEAIATSIPDARLELFEGGHIFMLQDPTAWPAVLDFLAEA